jgi:hypothetical protein
MGTSVPGDQPNTTSTTTGSTNPTPVTNPPGTTVQETVPGGSSPTPPTGSSGTEGGTFPIVDGHPENEPGAKLTRDDAFEAPAGAGAGRASPPEDVDGVRAAFNASGDLGVEHLMIRKADVDVLRRAYSDVERNLPGSADHFRDIFHRVF